ncbi:MAG: C69 family dipeptidase [Parafannyhessea umbonata]|uniref:dipeptidase n=1 Tax=Parafannyhessea umbonata TaxID=604330 RepID=UPI0026EA4A63|nr:C69 family dipeptidase [Parafannyhessea umbonata]MDD6565249.1 C69 family dipeptidase [Parafannyhessea umbonata]
MRKTHPGALGRFTRFGRAMTVAAAIVMAMPTGALACTQIYMGKGVTDTGDTYVGRSEDYASRHPKAFGIQEPRENPTFSSDESNFEWTFDGTTYRHTYVRDLPSGWDGRDDAYSEAGTNEKGVSVSATLTTGYNDKVKAVDPCGSEDSNDPSGIGEYTIPDVVLGCADTARNGVKLLGKIIDEKGSYDCNQIIIADSAETWVFMQLSGRQWCAVNLTAIAPDKVSVNPNMSNLKFDVNLGDSLVCLHSADLEKVAKEAGTATYFDDGQLDVATSYGQDEGVAQNTRYAQGRAYFGNPLADGTYTKDFTASGWQGVTSISDPELLFAPSGKVGLFQALRSYAARGEQTSDLNANTNSKLYAIGNNRTVETHMFQIRSGLTSDIATVQWEALSRAEFSVAVPVYSALLTEVDKTIYPDIHSWSEDHTGDAYERENVKGALDASTDNGSLDYVLMDINTLAYNYRDKLSAPTRAYLDALQKELISQQATVDGIMKQTPSDKRSDLANKLFEQASKETYAKAKALLDEMRTYVNGGMKGDFVPSDLDAAKGDLKAPIYYATAGVAPQITGQPQSATYEKGDKAADLKVTATIPDGAAGSDQYLTYKWTVRDVTADNVKADTTDSKANARAAKKSTVALLKAAPAAKTTTAAANDATGIASQSSTCPVDTSKVGTFEYQCTVTNSLNGKPVTSEVATITVNEKAPKPDDKPSTDDKGNNANAGNANANGGTAPSKKSPAKAAPGRLVSTGDTNNAMVPVAIAIAGVAIVVIALVVRKRNRE